MSQQKNRKLPSQKRMPAKDGKIAGQNTKKDTVTTLLFKMNAENFAEVFNRTLLQTAPVLPKELESEDIKETAYLRITETGGGSPIVQYRDTVKGVKNSRIFAILGIENQSEIDYAMPSRVLELDFVNYARQMRAIQERHETEWKNEAGQRRKPPDITDGEYLSRFLKTDRLIRCITLVIYWGEKPWDGPLRLSDMFADTSVFSQTVQFEMNLLDVCRMTDEEIHGYVSELRAVFGFRKYARDKAKLKNFIYTNPEYFNSISETALNALSELTHSPELKSIRAPKYQTAKGGFNMCQGIQEMLQDSREDGIREGIQEGIQEGKAAAIREMAVSLADMGFPVDKIAVAAGVSVTLVVNGR